MSAARVQIVVDAFLDIVETMNSFRFLHLHPHDSRSPACLATLFFSEFVAHLSLFLSFQVSSCWRLASGAVRSFDVVGVVLVE